MPDQDRIYFVNDPDDCQDHCYHRNDWCGLLLCCLCGVAGATN